jgi:hypothetical protein
MTKLKILSNKIRKNIKKLKKINNNLNKLKVLSNHKVTIIKTNLKIFNNLIIIMI